MKRLRLAALLGLLGAALVALLQPAAGDLLVQGEWRRLHWGPPCPVADTRWSVAVAGDDGAGTAAQAFDAAAPPCTTCAGAVAVDVALRFETTAGWFGGLSEVVADVTAAHTAGACRTTQRWQLTLAVDQGRRGDQTTALAVAGRTVATHLIDTLARARR